MLSVARTTLYRNRLLARLYSAATTAGPSTSTATPSPSIVQFGPNVSEQQPVVPLPLARHQLGTGIGASIVNALKLDPKFERFDPSSSRTDWASIDSLEAAMAKDDFDQFRRVLSAQRWPAMPHVSARGMLEFVLQNAIDAREAEAFFKEYASTSMKVWIPDVLPVRLAMRAAMECQSNAANIAGEVLLRHRSVFLARPRMLPYKLAKPLLQHLALRSTPAECIEFFDVAELHGYTFKSDLLCTVLLQNSIDKGDTFGDMFQLWETLAQHFSRCDGIQQVLTSALCNDESDSKRIGLICQFAKRMNRHPSSVVAELAFALARKGRDAEAAFLLNRVVVRPKDLRGAMRAFLESSSDPILFEGLCDLMMVNQRKKSKTAPDQPEQILDERLMKVIGEYAGFSANKKQKTLKKLKVNPNDRHDVIELIQNSFRRLSEDETLLANCDKRQNDPNFLAKHKQGLENLDWKDLHQATEYIEWRNELLDKHFNKLADFFKTDALPELTDRQWAIIFRGFGGASVYTPKGRRAEALSVALQKLSAAGIKLGPLAKTSVLRARIDNGQEVDVIAQLQEWETHGIPPTNEFCVQLARAYSVAQNPTGVSEIISYAKSENLAIDEKLSPLFLRALALEGKYSEAEQAIQRLAGADEFTRNELRLDVGEVAASRGDLEVLRQQLSLVSTNGLNFNSTKQLRRILCALLDGHHFDEAEKLRDLVNNWSHGRMEKAMALFQKKMYIYTWLRLKEGRLESALQAYTYLEKTNDRIQEQLTKAIAQRLCDKNHDFGAGMNMLRKASELGLISSPAAVLLQVGDNLSSMRLYALLDEVKDPNELSDALQYNPEKRVVLAEKILSNAAGNELPRSKRIVAVARLFCSMPEYRMQVVETAHKYICRAFNFDSQAISGAIKLLGEEPRTQRRLGAAIVDAYLRFRKIDLNADKELVALIDNKAIQRVDLVPIQRMFNELVAGIDDQNSKRLIPLAARIMALGFSGKNAFISMIVFLDKPAENEHTEPFLIRALTKAKPEIADALVDCLVLNHSSVNIAKGRFADLKTKYGEKIVETLEKLQRRDSTWARRMRASVEDLERELEHLKRKNEDYDPTPLYVAILTRIRNVEPFDLHAGIRYLIAFGDADLKHQSKDVWHFKDAALRYANQEGRFDEALQILETCPTITPDGQALLRLVAGLFLNDRVVDADAITARLKNRLTLRVEDVAKVGKSLEDYSFAQLEGLEKYLIGSLNMDKTIARHVVNAGMEKRILKCIEAGDLETAFAEAMAEAQRVKTAFGWLHIARAAVAANNRSILSSVFDLITRYHDRNSASTNIGYVLLEAGHVNAAEKMLTSPGLQIPIKVYEYLVRRAAEDKRVDVLRSMFDFWAEGNFIPQTKLNQLLGDLIKIYYATGDFTAISNLQAKCKELSFPLAKSVREEFELAGQKERCKISTSQPTSNPYKVSFKFIRKRAAGPASASSSQSSELLYEKYLRIALRLPDGRRVEAHFLPSDPIKALFDKIHEYGFNYNVVLVLNYPKRMITAAQFGASLLDLGIVTDEVLYVEIS
ncbi:unnamed protein product, partial [Mesorhabditis spiculigera]